MVDAEEIETLRECNCINPYLVAWEKMNELESRYGNNGGGWEVVKSKSCFLR